MIATIDKLVTEGHSGLGWYDGARAEIERLHGKRAETYAQFLAATSPLSSVQSNVTLANRAMRLYRPGVLFTPEQGFIGAHLANLNKVVEGQPLSGPKVSAFYRAIWGDCQAVVVDRWILRAWGYRPQASGAIAATPARVRDITREVRDYAREVGQCPRAIQAAIWTATKQRLDERNNDARALDIILREQSDG